MAKKVWRRFWLEKEGQAPVYLVAIIAGLAIGLIALLTNKTTSPYAIQPLNSGPWQFTNRHPDNQFQVYFGEQNNQPKIEFQSGRGSLVLIPQIQAQDWEKETVNGQDTLRIKNAYPEADIIYQIKENGLKEEIILNKRPKQKRFAFYFNSAQAVSRRNADDDWFFYSSEKDQHPFAYMPKLFMVDAKGEKSELVRLFHIVKNGKEYFEIEPDYDWLVDPQRVYPVTIDPSLEVPEDKNEIIEKRTASAKIFDNPGPGYTWVGYTTSIHYQDKKGFWQNTDTTIRKSSDPDYAFEVTRNSLRVYFASKIGQLPYYLKSKIHPITFYQGMPKSQPGLGSINLNSTAQVENNVLTYPQLFPGVDLKYTVTSTRIIEEYVIYQPETAAKISTLTQVLKIEGGVLTENDDGSLSFIDKSNQGLLLRAARPFMRETKKADDQEEFFRSESQGIIYTIKTTDQNNYFLSKTLTPEGRTWLQSPQRHYPIFIDPITINEQVLGNTVNDAYDTGASGGCVTTGDPNNKIRMGRNLDTYYSAGFRFTTVNVPRNITVTTSYLSIYGDGLSGTGTPVVKVYMNNVDDCATFSGTGCVTGRARTSASSANWSLQNSYTWYNSGQFNNAIREVTVRGGWAANQDMCALAIRQSEGSTVNYARIHDYTFNNTHGAKLSFTYNSPTPIPPTSTPTSLPTNAPTNTPTPTLPPYATDTPAPPGPFRFEGLKIEGIKIN